MEFLTLQDYRDINNLQRPETSKDIENAITAANAFVTRWLNFEATEDYIEINPNRQKYFVNPNASSIDSIEDLDGNVITGYKLLSSGTIYFPTAPTFSGMFKVNSTLGGFTTVPQDLKQAVAMLVSYWTKKEYLESRTFGGETSQYTTKTTGIPTHVRSILELYRNY